MTIPNPISGLASSLAAYFKLPLTEVENHLQQAKLQGRRFTSYLVESQLVSSSRLADFCEEYFSLPVVDLDAFDLNELDADYLNLALIDKHRAIPVEVRGRTLYLALADPTNTAALEQFSFHFGLHTEPLLVEEGKLTQRINRLHEGDAAELKVTSLDLGLDEGMITNIEVEGEESRNNDALGNSADDAPIVKYINKMMLDAIRQGASDLHFEPYETLYRIRFRIDGILHEVAKPPVKLASRFAARLKVMARLDIAERRLPQDGRIKLRLSRNKAIDMRVSSLPTLWGEKIVIRLLDSSAASLNIDQLGFDEEQKALYLKVLARPQGMILVTGPTGSGKTVTLYTGLNILNTIESNISTAEDPIEINLSGVNQVQINPKAGLTFAGALRSFLRQDPDIVMVGEVRDLETAEIAIKAAQTGHLVLSTLHTNSAAETLTRLSNMGVQAYNIAASVTLIIAQRLVRRLCPHCKVPYLADEDELRLRGFTTEQIAAGMQLYQPNGCERCSGGYRGRIGLYEMLPMSSHLAGLIMRGEDSLTLQQQAELEGMKTLRHAGLEKARLGVTSLAEVERVTTN